MWDGDPTPAICDACPECNTNYLKEKATAHKYEIRKIERYVLNESGNREREVDFIRTCVRPYCHHHKEK